MNADQMKVLLDKVMEGYGDYAEDFLRHGYTCTSLSLLYVLRLAAATLMMAQ
jgi:hypothetical protein